MEHGSGLWNAAINSLPFEAGIVDEEGRIVHTNGSWDKFNQPTDHDCLRSIDGHSDYLSVCEAAAADGKEGAEEIALELEDVLEGRSNGFARQYPCEDPLTGEPLQYVVRAIAFDHQSKRFVAIIHVDESERLISTFKYDPCVSQLSTIHSLLETDIQGPLEEAQSYVEMLDDSMISDRLEESLNRLDQITNEGTVLAEEPVNDVEQINLAEFAERAWAETTDVDLEVKYEGEVKANEAMLQFAFQHLFEMSLDGGATLVRLVDSSDGFIIEDNGIGISPTVRQKAFEDEKPAAVKKGNADIDTLTVVRRVFEEHGWTVKIQEAENGGLRVIVNDVSPT